MVKVACNRWLKQCHRLQCLSIHPWSWMKMPDLIFFLSQYSPVSYLSSVDIVEDKVELLWGLEGVVQVDQEGVLQALQQDIPLGHDILLLQGGRTKAALRPLNKRQNVYSEQPVSGHKTRSRSEQMTLLALGARATGQRDNNTIGSRQTTCLTKMSRRDHLCQLAGKNNIVPLTTTTRLFTQRRWQGSIIQSWLQSNNDFLRSNQIRSPVKSD